MGQHERAKEVSIGQYQREMNEAREMERYGRKTEQGQLEVLLRQDAVLWRERGMG